mmetsp:Transcript_85404/g.236670  ORF Transcript_85404/g.236670 Transcript_85404/m.236670 type:complete len:201 (-) Transcript_85404:1038-1640(-)
MRRRMMMRAAMKLQMLCRQRSKSRARPRERAKPRQSPNPRQSMRLRMKRVWKSKWKWKRKTRTRMMMKTLPKAGLLRRHAKARGKPRVRSRGSLMMMMTRMMTYRLAKVGPGRRGRPSLRFRGEAKVQVLMMMMMMMTRILMLTLIPTRSRVQARPARRAKRGKGRPKRGWRRMIPTTTLTMAAAKLRSLQPKRKRHLQE